MVSFILPAHNEELLIAGAVRAAHDAARAALGDRPYEVIVANDASTDRTGEIARAEGARVVDVQKRQISATRNAGAAAASRDVPADRHLYVFVDGDTMINAETLAGALRATERGCVGGGGAVRMDGPIPLYARVLLRMTLTLFRVLKYTGGCFFFVRRDHFEAVGGWDETLFASEEIELANKLKKRGRFAFVTSPVVTSGRKLRTYSAREIFGAIGRIMLKGRKGMSSRDALGIWYDPRRPDPHTTVEAPVAAASHPASNQT